MKRARHILSWSQLRSLKNDESIPETRSLFAQPYANPWFSCRPHMEHTSTLCLFCPPPVVDTTPSLSHLLWEEKPRVGFAEAGAVLKAPTHHHECWRSQPLASQRACSQSSLPSHHHLLDRPSQRVREEAQSLKRNQTLPTHIDQIRQRGLWCQAITAMGIER